MPCFKTRLLELFTKYIQIESGSDEKSNTSPSTAAQTALAKILEADLKKLGVSNIKLDANSYLTGLIPANTNTKAPRIGFFAHMDTYPGGTIGRTVKPQIHKNYQGGPIVVSKEHNVIITPENSASLIKCIGHDIITASGDTLLGADDKAGIAIIMAMSEHIINNPDIKHGDILIAFTPDEEIGRGPDNFDVAGFGADFAYTLDGEVGEGIVSENFNAASIMIKVKGIQAHPGFAKGIMENPVRILADIIDSWPENMLPETTANREGFICFTEVNADFEKGYAAAMVRDFEEEALKKNITLLETIVAEKRLKYPLSTIEFTVKEAYKNMKVIVDKNPKPLELAKEAFRQEGLQAEGLAIRGGTDGARLSFMGLPTPNIDAGYSTPHGPYEWTSLDAMSKVTSALIRIVENNIK